MFMMTEKHIRLYLKLLFFGVLLSLLAGCTQEGDDDFSLPRDKYIGSWLCQDDDGAGYYATITSGTSSIEVVINNYFNLRGTVTAIVTEATITVNKQEMKGIPGTFWCEGGGSLYSRNGKYTIEWKKYAAGDEERTSIYTKQ